MITRLQPGSIAAGVGIAAFALVAAAGLQEYNNGSEADGAVPAGPFKPLALAPASQVATDRVAPADRGQLARAIQKELARVGCYRGVLSSHWSPSARAAMKSFVDAVNARLPIDEPDDVLLTLVASHQTEVCLPPCGPDDIGRTDCAPQKVVAKEPDTAVVAAPSAPYRVAGEAPPQDAPQPAAPPALIAPASVITTTSVTTVAVAATVAPVAHAPAPSPLSNVEPIKVDRAAAAGAALPKFSTTVTPDDGVAKPQKRPTRKAKSTAPKQPQFVKSLMRSVNKTLSSLGFD